MAGVDGNGLTIKRLPDILEELRTSLRLQFGNDTPVDADSFFGVLNTIYGASEAEVWEVVQALSNQFKKSSATDKWLDDIGAYLKLTRLQPTKSKGTVSLFGTSGTVVPIGTEFLDTNGNVYETTEVATLSTGTSRTPINIFVNGGSGSNGELGTIYTITINGDVYTNQFNWPTSASYEDVVTSLTALIGDRDDYKAESSYEGNIDFVSDSSTFFNTSQSTNQTANTGINIINKDESSPITITVSVTQSPNETHYSSSIAFIGTNTKVSTFTDGAAVEATVTGAINTSLHTINSIFTPVTGLDSVDNEESVTVGRDLETDEEFRARISSDGSINGYGSQPAIEANLRQVEGVSFVDVQVNATANTDSNGRPANSFESIVIGGSDSDIAEVIFNVGGAGIQSYGNTEVSVADEEGNSQIVKFSRADEVFVWVKVSYTKNTEEVFPSNGESTMASSVLSYGESLSISNDVIPKRFFGSIYSNTAGIEDLTITLATSVDPLVEPDGVDFTSDILEIGDVEIPIFASSRIEIIEDI